MWERWVARVQLNRGHYMSDCLGGDPALRAVSGLARVETGSVRPDGRVAGDEAYQGVGGSLPMGGEGVDGEKTLTRSHLMRG
jgi:hypothetical protein